MSAPLQSVVHQAVEAVQAAEPLDAPAKALGKGVRGAIPGGAVKDAISGTWMGHALHPLLTDVVIGSWTSALAMDLLGEGRAASKLIALGAVAYPPTALTGVSDWADAEPADPGVRRVGLVHAASNGTALALQLASLHARAKGRRGTGVLLSLAAAGALTVGGHLGGHMSYVDGVGVDQTTFDPGSTDWTSTGIAPDELAGGTPVAGVAGETPVVLVRDGSGVRGLHDRCSHRGCSLASGEVDGGALVCPCHGSRFALADGEVLQGPATAPQPAFDVREHDGELQVRRRS